MHLLRLKRGTHTEPLDVAALQVTPIGPATVNYLADEDLRTPTFTADSFLFSVPNGGRFEGMGFRYVLLSPQNFINNPQWGFDEMLNGSGPVNALLLSPDFSPTDGVPIENGFLQNGVEGYLRYAP